MNHLSRCNSALARIPQVRFQPVVMKASCEAVTCDRILCPFESGAKRRRDLVAAKMRQIGYSRRQPCSVPERSVENSEPGGVGSEGIKA